MHRNPLILPCILVLLLCGGCSPQPPEDDGVLLAEFAANGATVIFFLEDNGNGQVNLAATFTPTETGYHLYSKDLPRTGVDGLGRPTLLELVPGSGLHAKGELTASLLPEDAGNGIPVYPAGPVTLRLEVTLPVGEDWVDEQVSVTYMVCSGNLCKAPVVDRIISIRVPCAGEYPKP